MFSFPVNWTLLALALAFAFAFALALSYLSVAYAAPACVSCHGWWPTRRIRVTNRWAPDDREGPLASDTPVVRLCFWAGKYPSAGVCSTNKHMHLAWSTDWLADVARMSWWLTCDRDHEIPIQWSRVRPPRQQPKTHMMDGSASVDDNLSIVVVHYYYRYCISPW